MTKPATSDKNMSHPVPANTVLDHSVLLSSVDGDTDLLRSISGLFLRSYPGFLSDIRDAIELKDVQALARAAHTLQGSGGHFLSNSGREALLDLEKLARQGTLNNAEDRLADLVREMECIKPELRILAGEEAPGEESEPAS